MSQPPSSSPPESPPPSPSVHSPSFFISSSSSTMKDVTSYTARPTRAALYTKKRPSPHGIAKARRTPVQTVTNAAACRSTPGQRLRIETQRQCTSLSAAFGTDTRLLEEEYRAEVTQYMYDMEQSTMSSAASIDQQPEINWKMRPCLVDFLVETHLVFKLRPETLYLTLNIIDRYCSRRVVFVKHYQLVGCAALWIAAKFEDAKERVPTVHDLHEICREAYDLTAFIQMEHHVLTTIQWMVGHPTAEAWLRLACCTIYSEDLRTSHVARFLMEITLFHREFIPFTASAISSGALILAQSICGKARRISEERDVALDVSELLDRRLANHLNGISEILVKKYGYAFYSKASTVVVQFYLGGKRFLRYPIPDLPPMTPLRSTVTPSLTPLSASTSCSSVSSDDMPVTPTQAPYGHDPFMVVDHESQKENSRPANVSACGPLTKRASMDITNDFAAFARPALQNLNGVSPSPRVILQ